MTALCPHCGYNLQADRPVYRDGWMIDPAGRVAFKGPALDIRVSWAGILYAIAAAPGLIATDALLNRVSNSENINVIAVQVCRLRQFLRANGLPDPIKGERGRLNHGYRWQSPARSTVATLSHAPEVSHA